VSRGFMKLAGAPTIKRKKKINQIPKEEMRFGEI
jgi:hypothetical protein